MPYKDKEMRREYDRQRYSEANKPKIMAQRRAYYENNKEKVLARTRAWTLKRMASNRQLVIDAKSSPCMDCGNSFPPCAMDFDHRPDETKTGTISRIVNNWKVSEAYLREEMAKCDLVCANCHRVRTQIRAGAPSIDWRRDTPCI
jgi:hypothetical protein